MSLVKPHLWIQSAWRWPSRSHGLTTITKGFIIRERIQDGVCATGDDDGGFGQFPSHLLSKAMVALCAGMKTLINSGLV